jgi:hypothetical protein
VSVISVQPVSGREFSGDESLTRTNVRKYRIICDSRTEEELTVAAQSGMPAILTAHPTLAGLRCTGVRVIQDEENPYLWVGTVTWSSLTIRGGGLGGQAGASNQHSDPGQRQENPLDRPAIMSFGSERFQRAVMRDLDGKAVVNSAGDPFEQGVMADDFRPTITVTKNVEDWNIVNWWKATNSINETPWLNFAPDSVRLVSITGEERHENDVHFFAKVCQFHVASYYEEDWHAYPLDCGYHELIPPGGGVGPPKRQAIVLPGSITPSSPVKLDGNGRVLATNADPKYIKFRIYRRYEFNNLDLF